MGRNVKTLRNLWWLQLLKRQKLTFLPNHRVGTERSEVRILSPRPLISTTYGCQHWRPYLLCGRFVTKILRTYISLKLNGANVSHCRLQILVAISVIIVRASYPASARRVQNVALRSCHQRPSILAIRHAVWKERLLSVKRLSCVRVDGRP